MTISAVFLVLALACLAAPACLYTGVINTPPVVQIIPPTEPINRGETVMIAATAYDPDGGPVQLEWSTGPVGDCMVPLDVSKRPPTSYQSPPGDPTFPLRFKPDDAESLCVWVLATDSQRATKIVATPVMSVNRKPMAAITVVEPTAMASNGQYELFSTFHLSAATSSDPDGDPVSEPMWQLLDMPAAANPTPKLVPCPSEAPTDFLRCLDVGGNAGTYTIGLTVFDGHDRSDMATKTLLVDYDHPACVSKTEPATAASPIVLDPGKARTLAITEILDDGAPLPTPVEGTHTPPAFQWQVSRNGGAPATIAGYETLAALTVPAGSYATGDDVVVSVTISDGVAMHLDPACDPRCPAGCPQTARWTLEYR
jgi:hypothetical protein